MNEEQAAVLVDVLDVATSGHWQMVASELVDERGYTPEQIVKAWESLERLAGMSGCCPSVEDFR